MYNELEIYDEFTTDVHPLYSKLTKFTVRDEPSSRPYGLAALILGVLSAVLLIVLIGLGVHMIGMKDKHNSLSLNSSRINIQLSDLQSDHKNVLDSKNMLQRKLDEDTNLIKSLQADLNTQQRLKTDLNTRNTNLQEENRKIKSLLSNLEGNCGKCSPNWLLFNSTCYYFAVSVTTSGWDGGREYCRKNGGDLVVIDTIEKQEFILNSLKAGRYNLPFSYQNGFWIGLKDEHIEGTWKWLNGSILTEGYWMDGEPNDDLSIEDCAAVYPTNNLRKAWNDVPCSHPLKWICEKKMEKTP